LVVTTLGKLPRALSHAHYTFRKRLSHTADSQDQRHRMVPGSRPLLQVAATDAAAPLLLVHGPEGGLSPQEEQALLALGYAPLTLGPRVLRAETAAIAALAALALSA